MSYKNIVQAPPTYDEIKTFYSKIKNSSSTVVISSELDEKLLQKLIIYLLYQKHFRKLHNIIYQDIEFEKEKPKWFHYYTMLTLVKGDIHLLYQFPDDFFSALKAYLKLSQKNDLTKVTNLIDYILYEIKMKLNPQETSRIRKGFFEFFKEFRSILKENGINKIKEFNLFVEEITDSHWIKLSDVYGVSEVFTNLEQFKITAYEHDNKTIHKKGTIVKPQDRPVSPELKKKQLKKEIEKKKNELNTIKENDIEKHELIDYDFSDHKILLIGSARINDNDILGVFKKQGFDKNNITLHTDYKKFKNLDVSKYKSNPHYSQNSNYSAILIGPIPHKMKGIEESNSLTDYLNKEENEEGFPENFEIRNHSRELKITKTSLKETIKTLKKHIISISNVE